MNRSGIYTIEHVCSGKKYVGQTVHFGHRWAQHRCKLRAGSHDNKHLQNAWSKHGENAFVFAVVALCAPNVESLNAAEQQHIDAIKPVFNKAPIAGSNLGIVFGPQSAAQRALASSRMLGKRHALGFKHPPEFGAKISANKKGYQVSAATRARISAAKTGVPRPFTAEHCKNLAMSLIGNRNSAKPQSKLHVMRRAASRRITRQRAGQDLLAWIYGAGGAHV